MKLSNIASVFLLSVFFSVNAFAQKNFYKEAEKKFNTFEYFGAIDLYKASYKNGAKKYKVECLWKIAECYRLINDPKQAEVYYQKGIKAKCTQATLATLYLADMLKVQEKYAEAKDHYEQYKKEVPSDKRGDNGVKSCELAQQWKDNPTRYKVENMVQFNSKDWDYAPMYAERKKYTTLLFSSTRQGATGDVDPNVGQLYADLFMTKVDKNGKWSTPTPLPAPISTENNEAACVLDAKGQNMYFTRCGVKKGKNLKCQIYSTVKRGQAWDEPQLMPFCMDSFSYGHPALSKDEKILIYSSDVKDSLNPGYGGLDLYYVIYDSKAKTWGKPVNLGPEINTDGNEMYPFIHDDGTLYFSSDGHLGMGGSDIFRAEKVGENKWGKVSNMRYPINSAGDDFAIIFEGEKERGYFTSNRAGGKGGDDIYSFILPPMLFMLEGAVTEESTKLPVPGATVKLVGSDNTSYEIKTDAKGYYKYDILNATTRYINAQTSYVVSASALDVKTADFPDGLLGNPKAKITTVGLKESTNFKQDFVLKKIVKEMRMPLVLFNLDKYDLEHPSHPQDSLEYLIQTMNENPNIVVELAAHTDYRNDAKYNQTLSFNRAKTCVDYIISKGIAPDRIVPAGYGESQPAITDRNFTLPSGKVLPKGTQLKEQWIDKNYPKAKNKDDYEAVMQINRRVVFKVLRKDYVPSGTKDAKAPEIKVTKSASEGGEGDTKTEWDDQ